MEASNMDARHVALKNMMSDMVKDIEPSKVAGTDINPSENVKVPSRKRSDLKAKIIKINGIEDGKKYIENVLYGIETFSIGDQEGKSELSSSDSEGMLTLDGQPVFVHGCIYNGQKYFLNNSKTKKCPDYVDQMKPMIDQVFSRPELITDMNIRHYLNNMNLFIDITTTIIDHYDHDTRGSGDFNQHIYIQGSLSSTLDWAWGLKAYRQVCGNGMFALTKTLIRHKRKTENFKTSDIDISIQKEFRAYDLLQQLELPSNIMDICKKLPAKWIKLVLEQAKIEGKPTWYALLNAFTYYLTHEDIVDSTRMQYENYCREIIMSCAEKGSELYQLFDQRFSKTDTDTSFETVPVNVM